MTTLDEEIAKELKMVDMYEHNLSTGVMTHFSRISTNDPWFAIGTAPTSARCVRQALGGAVPPELAAVMGEDVPATVPPAGCSMMGLAQSLQDAAAAVMSAAESLQRWAAEVAAAVQGPAQPVVCAA